MYDNGWERVIKPETKGKAGKRNYLGGTYPRNDRDDDSCEAWPWDTFHWYAATKLFRIWQGETDWNFYLRSSPTLPPPQSEKKNLKSLIFFLTRCIHFSPRLEGNWIVNGETYGPWSDWSPCSVQVGEGFMTRNRDCIVEDCPSPGEYIDYMKCFVKPCPCECPTATGNWLTESDLTFCSVEWTIRAVSRLTKCSDRLADQLTKKPTEWLADWLDDQLINRLNRRNHRQAD